MHGTYNVKLVEESLRGKYPEGDVTYKAKDYTTVEGFSAMGTVENKRKTRKRHVLPGAGRDDTAAAIETTRKNLLP